MIHVDAFPEFLAYSTAFLAMPRARRALRHVEEVRISWRRTDLPSNARIGQWSGLRRWVLGYAALVLSVVAISTGYGNPPNLRHRAARG